MKQRTLYLIILILFWNGIAAQFEYQSEHLTVVDGLSQNDVNCIFQDSYGYIWIGTGGGLNRYDGYSFKNYYNSPQDSSSLSWNTVYDITEDGKGQLWIATQSGLSRYIKTSNSFINYSVANSPLVHSYVSGLVPDTAGNVWVCSGSGLNYYNCQTDSFETYRVGEELSLTNLRMYRGFCMDTSGNLWMGAEVSGVLFFDVHKKEVQQFSTETPNGPRLLTDSIMNVFCDSHNNVWYSYANIGVSCYSIAKDTTIHYTHIPSRVNVIFENTNKDILLGTDGNGCVRYSNGIFHEFSSEHTDLFNDKLTVFLEDYQNSVWVGYRHGGVGFFEKNTNPIASVRYGENLSLPYNLVNDILVDSKERVWIANDKGGLLLVRSDTIISMSAQIPELKQTLLCLYEGRDSTLWLGSYQNGLSRFVPETQQYENYRHIPNQSGAISGNDIRCISQDKYGNLWLAVHGLGFSKFNIVTGKFENFHFTDTTDLIINGEWSYTILCVGDDVWVGSTIGLYRYNQITGKSSFYRYNKTDSASLSDNVVSCLYSDSKNRLWVGTQMGLNLFLGDKSGFERFAIDEGLIDNGINSIIEDDAGHIWVATGKGLSRLNYRTHQIINYNSKDGLQGNEFAKNASSKSEDGYLYFGGFNGFSRLNPAELKVNTTPPKVYLSDFLLYNKSVVPGGKGEPLQHHISETKLIELKHNQNVISFEFIALNYIHPEKNQYAYKLEGLDVDWVYCGYTRKVNYSNLDYGDYVFRVKASNNDGIWNDVGISVAVTIHPPIWFRWYAYVVYVLLGIWMLYFFRKFSIISVTKKSELLFKHLEQEKVRDINQAKLQFFTDISHEIRTPLTLIIDPVNRLVDSWSGEDKIKNQLTLIQKNSNKMLQLINQLLDFRKVETGNEVLQCVEDNIAAFVFNIAAGFLDFAKQRKINLMLPDEGESIICYFDKDKVDKIVTNLISNALKFTPEDGAVTIHVFAEEQPTKQFGNGNVTIEVEDTGVGIPLTKSQSIFERFKQLNNFDSKSVQGSGIGLALAKHLVDLHKGVLNVKSELGKGSVFSFQIPLGKDHLLESEIVTSFFEPRTFVADEVVSHEEKDKDRLILLVEDDADILKYFADILIEDYNIITAMTGKSGYDMAVNNVPDLIISDVQMPEMDGNEMTGLLKQNPITSHIPIVLLTARNLDEQQLESLQYGADEYITKPVDTTILKQKIRNILLTLQNQNARIKKQLASDIDIPSDEVNSEIDFITKVRAVIEKQLSNSKISVQDIADEMGMSRTQLFRKFKAILNQNPKDFIQTTRLLHSKQMLISSGLSIKEIAYALGFSDQRYFSRLFNKEFGMSPTAWRESQIES